MDKHPVYRITHFEVVGPYTIRVVFDDGLEQEIDFQPVLEGEMYGPLKEEKLFSQVELDPEVHTLVWPNGADFDPETLHDWEKYGEELKKRAQSWATARESK